VSGAVVRYEESAEHRQVEGWCCTVCDRFWGDSEHMARYCCHTEKDCSCGRAKCDRYRTACDLCVEDKRKAAWAAREKHPCPDDWSVNPICVQGDRYFFDESDWQDFLADLDPGADLNDLEPFICERQEVPEFDLNNFLCDFLPEDEFLGETEVEDKINELIRQAAPRTFSPTNKAIDVETLPKPWTEHAEAPQ
jgi:hypothetical protein